MIFYPHPNFVSIFLSILGFSKQTDFWVIESYSTYLPLAKVQALLFCTHIAQLLCNGLDFTIGSVKWSLRFKLFLPQKTPHCTTFCPITYLTHSHLVSQLFSSVPRPAVDNDAARRRTWVRLPVLAQAHGDKLLQVYKLVLNGLNEGHVVVQVASEAGDLELLKVRPKSQHFEDVFSHSAWSCGCKCHPGYIFCYVAKFT